jgi:4-alpha-glucanotransferase
VVAGVPPVFSATGQRWGNPLRWAPATEGRLCLVDRADAPNKAELVDIVRIDHFCGFAGLLNPAGRRHPGTLADPGAALFHAMKRPGHCAGRAEDLGLNHRRGRLAGMNSKAARRTAYRSS